MRKFYSPPLVSAIEILLKRMEVPEPLLTDLFNGPILNGGDVRIPTGNVHFSLGSDTFLFMKALSVASVSSTL